MSLTVALMLSANVCDDRLTQGTTTFSAISPTTAKAWFCSNAFIETFLPTRVAPFFVRLRGQMVPFESSLPTTSLEKRRRFCTAGTVFLAADANWLALQTVAMESVRNWVDCLSESNELNSEVRSELVEKTQDTLFANVGLHSPTSAVANISLAGTLGSVRCPTVAIKPGLTLEGNSLRTEKCSSTNAGDGFLILRIGDRWAIASRFRRYRGSFAGEAIVELVLPGQRRESIVSEHETGDHHCTSNCNGEPTRTRYVFRRDAPSGRILKHPNLQCISGPCHGWNEVVSVQTDDAQRSVTGTVDVWTNPTRWRLSTESHDSEDRNMDGESIVLFWGKRFSVVAPSDAKSVRLRARLTTHDQFLIDVRNPDAASPFILRSISPSDSQIIYTIELKDH